jgi:hypothetical protein
MSLTNLKADAAKILQSTARAKAPDVLADHLLLKKNRPQLVALAEFILATLVPKREAAKPHARRRAGPHRRRQKRALMPSHEQKAGALLARAHVADQDVFDHKLRGGKKLGDIKVHELANIVEASANTAVQMLNRGYEDIVDTLLCAALGDHCVAADPFGLVKDTIKKTEATKILAQAKIRAAEVLRDKSALLAKELIALAHERGGPAELGR